MLILIRLTRNRTPFILAAALEPELGIPTMPEVHELVSLTSRDSCGVGISKYQLRVIASMAEHFHCRGVVDMKYHRSWSCTCIRLKPFGVPLSDDPQPNKVASKSMHASIASRVVHHDCIAPPSLLKLPTKTLSTTESH